MNKIASIKYVLRFMIGVMIAALPLVMVFSSKASLFFLVFISLLIIILACTVDYARARSRMVEHLKTSRLIHCFGCFALYAGLSSFWSIAPLVSLKILVFEFVLPIFMLALVLALDDEVLHDINIRWCVVGFILGGAVLVSEIRSDMVLRQWLGLRLWAGSLAHAGVTLAFISPVLYYYLSTKSRFQSLIFLISICVILAFLISDAAKLAMIIFVLGYALFSQQMIKMRYLVFSGLALYMFAQPWIWSVFGAQYLSSTFMGFKLSSVHRLYIWETFSNLVLLNPLYGYGIASGHFLHSIDRLVVQLPEILRLYVDAWHPHNNFLEIWLDLGAIGILTATLCIYQIFMTDWIKSKAHFSSLLSILAVGACSHGLWQGWWIATACLVVLLYKIADAKIANKHFEL